MLKIFSAILAGVLLVPLALAAQTPTPRPAPKAPAVETPTPKPVPKPPAAETPTPKPAPKPPAGEKTAPAKPQAAPKAEPAKSYKLVPVRLPEPMKDESFETFRKQLAEAARKNDRAVLGKLVVSQGFFWEGDDGERADKKKSGLDNLVSILGLDRNGSDGWDMLGSYARDPTAMPLADRKGVFCAPADPDFSEKALEDVAKATGTDPGEWGYPMASDAEVRASAKADAPVTEKLGMHFVRVIPDDTPPAPNQIPMLKVITPSGKIGFVTGDALAPLGNDQLCYVKDGGGWKITGYIGGEL